MADISKVKLPNDNTEYVIKDGSAVANITRNGTTFTATRRNGTTFTFTQQDNNTTYTVATGDSNGQIKVTPSSGSAYNVNVKGLASGAYKAVDTAVTSGSANLITSGAVYTAIDNLPEPMVFKGSLGTGGTITALPIDGTARIGDTYKVITAGTYASQPAKLGDTFICDTKTSSENTWVHIPSGDEPSGTVTSITLKATSPIAIDSSSAITTSGTRTLSHANSGVTAGTYRSVTVNATGHVTAGTNPTTLSGYGITDAKIANGVITLGSNTITPLTSHQTVTDNNPTLAWGTKSKVATIGSTAINVTMPSNPNTDTKVTAVGNHYTPAEDSTAQLDADASSTTAATWNSTSLVTGITVKRDAKGHVTGIAVDSIKMPANPNTNTTYTLGTSGNNITLTPSSGSAQSITAPYATSAGSATKATQDGSGNTITSTYVKKSGDTMTGELKLYREGTTTQNLGTYLTFQNKDTTTGKTSNGYIVGYDGGENGINLVINPAGNMFIGSGEAGRNHYDLYTHNTGENFYATSDTHIYLQANGQTIANRAGMIITNGHTIVPCKADVTTNNTGSIGTSSARWAGMYAMKYNGLLTGTGTAGQDKGSGTTNRYVPAKWTFNIGSNTVGEGDLFVIKLPVAGHDYGTYLSLNNGTNYYPVIYNTSTRLTSHFPASSCIIVTFDSAGSAGSIFPLNGGDARTTVSGGAFRVVDFYDSGNSTVNQAVTTTDANYEVLFSGTADNTTHNEGSRKNNNLTFNPSTGTLTTSFFVEKGSNGGAWHLGRRYATIKKTTANNTSTFYPIWSVKTYTGDWCAGTLGTGGEDLYFVNTLDTNYSSNVNKGRKYRFYGSSNTDDNTTYDIVFKTSFTSGQVVVADGTSGLIKTSGYTIAKSVPSDAKFTDTTYTFTNKNATLAWSTTSTVATVGGVDIKVTMPANPNTDKSVQVNNTNPTSGTWYYPVWYTASSGTGQVNANDGLGYYSLQGTASEAGRTILKIGNEISTGTAGNKYGEIWLYSKTNGNVLLTTSADANKGYSQIFPPVAGIITIMSSSSITSGNVIIADGTSGGVKVSSYTIEKSVPSNAKFTDTNTWRGIQDNLTSSTNTTESLSAKQGYLLANGSARDSTKVAKSGDTMTGILTLHSEGTTANNYPARLTLSVKDTTTGQRYADSYIAAYNDHGSTTYGNNIVIHSGGGMFLGGGESPAQHYAAKGSYSGEDCFITSDSSVYVQANGNTIGNRIGFAVNTNHEILPVKADTGTNNIGSIGNTNTRWANLYVTTIQGGTAINTQYKDTTTNTTGFCMHGRDGNNKYSCIWSSSKLNFYVDTTNVGNVSDRQLKSEIDEIDPKLLEAIAECEIYQYKAFNRDGLISVGIMAQDLVEKCEEKGVRPENYELLTKMNFIQGDDTLYYSVDYNQYATLMIDYLQKKVKELEEKIK